MFKQRTCDSDNYTVRDTLYYFRTFSDIVVTLYDSSVLQNLACRQAHSYSPKPSALRTGWVEYLGLNRPAGLGKW